MHYLSHIPSKITLDTKCIIMLHGVGSNENDLFSLHEQFGEDIMVYSLQGPFSLGMGRYAWYPVDFSTGKPVYTIDDVETSYKEITSCIDEVGEKYGIERSRIFLFGFSQGAIMSYYTLWKSPEKIGGIIALSGRLLAEIDYLDGDTEKYQGKHIFISHGKSDTVIPVTAAEVTSGWVRSIGLEPTLELYESGHTIIEEEIQDIQKWLNSFDK